MPHAEVLRRKKEKIEIDPQIMQIKGKAAGGVNKK